MSKKVSIVIPQSRYTFSLLSNETQEQARNRFIYYIVNANIARKSRFIEELLEDCFHTKVPDLEVTFPEINILNEIKEQDPLDCDNKK